MTTLARDALKAAILQRLAGLAVEHPSGHQGKLAARFVLRSHSGEGIELMFEKGPATPANLWMHRKFAEQLPDTGIERKESPASALFAVKSETGKTIYGRHAGLLSMRQLADADLVCFKLKSTSDLEAILEALRRQ